MSIDRTLKTSGGLLQTRSVLTRAERIVQLTEEGKFDPETGNPMGLPKVKIRRSRAGAKTKKAEVAEDAEGTEAAEGADAAATKDE